jgi:hypothetical protein
MLSTTKKKKKKKKEKENNAVVELKEVVKSRMLIDWIRLANKFFS